MFVLAPKAYAKTSRTGRGHCDWPSWPSRADSSLLIFILNGTELILKAKQESFGPGRLSPRLMAYESRPRRPALSKPSAALAPFDPNWFALESDIPTVYLIRQPIVLKKGTA